MHSLDVSAIPVVDNHCHTLYRDQPGIDLGRWRRLLTESTEPETETRHGSTTLLYTRLVHRLARFLECEDDDTAVLRARMLLDGDELVSSLLRDANIGVLLLDDGFPPRDEVLDHAEFGRLAGCRAESMLRVEIVMQRLIAECDTLGAVEDALADALQDVRAQGFVALKSIVAYRTGLDIRRWPRAEAEAEFAAAREESRTAGTVRLARKPLLDTLLHTVFTQAAWQEIPIQFHTGYGDTDADMLRANPLHLRAVLEEPAYRGMPVVLLHESYPYTRQGAYLAAMYDAVYLDLSYAIPFLGYREMEAFTRGAFGVAPYSKLMYSSDGVGLPELHWMSAIDGRRIIADTLADIVRSGDLTLARAEAAATAVLHDNARQLYGL